MIQKLRQRAGQWLRWSERFTKTDMIYLTKGGFWLTMSKVLSVGASFLSSIAFANLLAEETYGVFRYVLAVCTLLAIPTLHGIDISLTRALSRGDSVSIPTLFATRVQWGLLGGLASFILGAYYFFMGNTLLALLFSLSAFFIPIMDPLHIYTSVLSGLKKFNALARDEVATRVLTALLLVSALFFTQNVLILVAIYFISTTLARYLFFRRSFVHLPQNTDPDTTRDVVRYGTHLTAMGALGQISTQLDKILLFQFVNGAALATFYLAFIPFKQMQTLFSGITTLAFPKFSANSIEQLRETLPHKLLKMYAIVIPLVAIYIFAAPYLFAFLYPHYMDAVLPSQILSTLLLLFPLSLLGTALTSQGEKKKLYVHSSLYGALRIILLLILIPLYGMYGAIIAIILTAVISNIILVFLFFRDDARMSHGYSRRQTEEERDR